MYIVKSSTVVDMWRVVLLIGLTLAEFCQETSGYSYKSSGDGLEVHISESGSYDVIVDGVKWLSSGDTWLRSDGAMASVAGGSLKLAQAQTESGWDAIGSWEGKSFLYQVTGAAEKVPAVFMLAEIRVYASKQVVRWGQTYLNDTYGTSYGSTQKTSGGFPTFHLFDSSDPLGYYVPKGYFMWEESEHSRWSPSQVDLGDGYKMGPLALFDQSNRTFILSHFTNFMGASYWYDAGNQTFNVGPLGKAEMIPKGFSIWTIGCYDNQGINKAFQAWGDIMTTYYSASNREFGKTDLVNNYLGYWTDNGLCYYYYTEPNTTYQQTMIDIWKDTQRLQIPIQYLQYDSWFYPKDAEMGLLEWIPDKTAFPNGMQYVLNQTNLSAASHCRWWSPKTPMAKQNGGKYDFIIEKKMALPTSDNFFYDIMSYSKTWGNQQFNQDWLGQMFEGLKVLQTNVTIGTQYMRQLGRAAMATNMMVELCTAYPRHTLAGLEIPTATVNRASDDYKAGNSQWKIGVNAAWMWPLGQTSFKDAYWTSKKTCPRFIYMVESRPELESVVVALLAGPTGWGDLIGQTNRSLLMRCCNEDGLILKPSKPASAIDDMFQHRSYGGPLGQNGEVWTTYSEISGLHFGIIFASLVPGPYSIGPTQAGFGDWLGSYSVFHYTSLKTGPFSSKAPLVLTNCTEHDFCLYHVTPNLKLGSGQNVVLYGELSKWIPVSPKRVQSIEAGQSQLRVTLVGRSQERVTMTAGADGTLAQYTCTLSKGGHAILSLPSGECEFN